MKDITQSIRTIFLRFFTLSLVSALLVASVYTDVVVLEDGLKEISITEITQEVILFIVAFLFFSLARKDEKHRGFLILAAGFFATMLIRELDQLFDLISHGFWFYPATATSLAAIGFAFHYKESTSKGLRYFVNHKQFISVCNALVIILVFSRLFGMGELWHGVLSDGYARDVKNVIEEGTELLGYKFLLVGVVSYYFSCVKLLKRRNSEVIASELELNATPTALTTRTSH